MWHIKGCIQHYEWGGTRFIPDLMGLNNPENKPFAELWMGMHPGCPSTSLEGISLRDIINVSPDEIFTPAERDRWCDELPFLCKILDVNDMLSIQLHPDKKSAEKGFEKEEKEGIPVGAFNRSFKDRNHKPELMYALSPFYLLHAFRPDEEIVALLEKRKPLRPIAEEIRESGLPSFYRNFMQKDQDAINEILAPFVRELKQMDVPDDPTDPDYWALRAVNKYCTPEKIDRGILSFYLLHLLSVEPGTVIYQDSGVPHAYLRGQTIEVMANSDNVIRGGLTPKYVDDKMLSQLVRFDQRDIYQLKPSSSSSGIAYQPPVEEFSFSVVEVPAQKEVRVTTKGVSMFFSVSDCFIMVSDQQKIRIGMGEAVLCAADESFTIHTQENARVFWVTTGEGN